jgi:hypothetical protein
MAKKIDKSSGDDLKSSKSGNKPASSAKKSPKKPKKSGC